MNILEISQTIIIYIVTIPLTRITQCLLLFDITIWHSPLSHYMSDINTLDKAVC